jgi:methyl-accepting chemotaxis protein WspA
MNLKERFNQFQGKFTYRQRFLFFGVVYFLFIPTPVYYVLHTTNLFIESKKIEVLGIQYQEYVGSILDTVLQSEIIRFKLMPNHEMYLSELKTLESKAAENFDKLSLLNQSLVKLNNGKGVGKFFSKNFTLNFGIEKWQPEWDNIRQTNEKNAALKKYKTLVASLSNHAIEIGKALNLYGVSNSIISVLLRPMLDFLIPFQVFTTEATLLYENQSAFIPNLKFLRDQEKIHKQGMLKSILPLIQKYPKQQDLFQQIRKEMVEYFNSLDTLFQSMEKSAPLDEVGSSALLTLKKNRNLRVKIMDAVHKRLIADQRYYEFLYWFNLSVILFVATLVLIFVFLRVITRHLSNLLVHTQNLSQGHFIKCFCSENKDEFGEVGRAFDSMSSSFEKVSLELHDLSWKLSSATEQIAKATGEQETNVSNQEERVKEIEATTQKISQDTRYLADTMQKLSVHILQESMADKAKESLDIMRTKIKDLGEASQSIVGLLEKVEEKMHGMENLIAFMTKVSENANLLSLNAAIETATVSHHKESFAAISQKIQRFANLTVISTQDIKKILQVMSSNVSNVKSYSISCLKEIGVGADELINFSSQLSKITRQGKEQFDQFKNFTMMMQAQANETEMMIKSITHLRKTAQNNTTTIQNVNKILAELSSTANELKNILKLFEKVDHS